jgi:glutaredoxin
MHYETVAGTSRGELVLYALSTCIWCQKTKKLLADLGVAFAFVYVDLLSEKEQEEAVAAMAAWNPAASFPTLIIDHRECIIGYKPDELKKRFG